MLLATGKMEIITQTKIRGCRPKGKIAAMTGTIASTGVACKATRYGYTARSAHFALAMMTARDIPTTMVMINPTPATSAVQARPLSSLERGPEVRKA